MVQPVIFQKLQRWQSENNVNDDALAALVGEKLGRRVNRSTIYRAKRGQRVLGMDLQLALQKVTKTVAPADWAEFNAMTVSLRSPARQTQKKSRPASVVREVA